MLPRFNNKIDRRGCLGGRGHPRGLGREPSTDQPAASGAGTCGRLLTACGDSRPAEPVSQLPVPPATRAEAAPGAVVSSEGPVCDGLTAPHIPKWAQGQSAGFGDLPRLHGRAEKGRWTGRLGPLSQGTQPGPVPGLTAALGVLTTLLTAAGGPSPRGSPLP